LWLVREVCRDDAYPYGAILERTQIRELQEEKPEPSLSAKCNKRNEPEIQIDDPTAKETSLLQWRDTRKDCRNTPPVGRLVIHVSQQYQTVGEHACGCPGSRRRCRASLSARIL
jgi:hypothetical protein